MWFDVDKKGLAKILGRRGKEYVVYELIQNAWDQDSQKVSASLCKLGRRRATLVVEDDDPKGFASLSDAWTLFAEDNPKRADPGLRGRFNLGEKLVLALCDKAEIVTTVGSVVFDARGRRRGRLSRVVGSRFQGTLRLNEEEFAQACGAVRRLIPPKPTTFNGVEIPSRTPVKSFQAELPTEVEDAQGLLRRARRKAEVRLYDVLPGEEAMLYEMGIPVVETGDKWHVEVMQKIPLNLDRDNVPPSYLRLVRTLVLNEAHGLIGEEDANQPWVREATSDSRCSKGAVRKALEGRFGKDYVSFDPSDLEANKRAVAAGYTVVTGGMMNKQEWENARGVGIQPAGKVTPSPKPYSDDPNAKPEELVPEGEWTHGMRMVADYARLLAHHLLGVKITVRMTRAGNNFGACYGGRDLTLNLRVLPETKWFTGKVNEEHDALLIHEFAHEHVGDHLSDEFHRETCRLGAKLAELALARPGIFAPFRKVPGEKA